MPGFLHTVLAFLVVLGVLVFVHEFGHYLAARWCRVHVEVFSIGFGPAITAWRDRLGTVWRVAWLPLGGYVRLHGQEQPGESGGLAPTERIPGGVFHEKPVGARATVVAAGPIANFLLAIVLFAALFATAGRPTMLPVATDVVPGGAAAQAGIHKGDTIIAIDGNPITSFEDIQRVITARPAERLTVAIRRGDTTLDLPVVTGEQESGGKKTGMLGIRGGDVAYQRLSVPAALLGGVTETWQVTSETLVSVAQMITGQRGTADLGGPLRIAQLSGEVASLGLASLVQFIALLSVNLGLINLFPIPVLDGGHLLFYLAEAIRGRPIPLRAQEYGLRAGLAVLAGLFIFATWNDLLHLGLF